MKMTQTKTKQTKRHLSPAKTHMPRLNPHGESECPEYTVWSLRSESSTGTGTALVFCHGTADIFT